MYSFLPGRPVTASLIPGSGIPSLLRMVQWHAPILPPISRASIWCPKSPLRCHLQEYFLCLWRGNNAFFHCIPTSFKPPLCYWWWQNGQVLGHHYLLSWDRALIGGHTGYHCFRFSSLYNKGYPWHPYVEKFWGSWGQRPENSDLTPKISGTQRCRVWFCSFYGFQMLLFREHCTT